MNDLLDTLTKGHNRNSGYDLAAHEWYVEPRSCVDTLFDAVRGLGQSGTHDPCCGMGTIPDTATARGWSASGADLIDRTNGRFGIRNFLHDQNVYPNIVTNPPFKLSVPIVEHALSHVQLNGVVAIIAQAKFLYSQGRHPLFTRPECERVLILSKRPSMPPGELLMEKGKPVEAAAAWIIAGSCFVLVRWSRVW